jgi:hypothetical protein
VATNKNLLKILVIPFLTSLGVTVASLVLLFIFAFPALTILFVATGPLAPVIAAVLCLGLSGLISFIAFQVLFGRATTEIKLFAMEEQGVTEYMLEKYGFKDVPDVGVMADAMTTIRFLGLQVFMMVLTSPLNAAPGVGTAVFCFVNGWLSTWESMSDLLPMIGYKTCFQQMHHMFRHFISYFAFGFSAFGLMLFPVVNVLFAAGIAYGAAILFGHYCKEDRIGPAGLPVNNNDPDNNNNKGTESLPPRV